MSRRYGAVEGGRFCFEGGTRCGRGEGVHVVRSSSRYVDIESTRYYLHRYLGQLLGHCQNVLIISDTGEAEERGE